MAFMLYFVGFVVFAAGLASLATALGMSDTLVTGGALAIIAIGFLAGLVRHRARESRASV
jgi:positive regulator of sigma E activity